MMYRALVHGSLFDNMQQNVCSFPLTRGSTFSLVGKCGGGSAGERNTTIDLFALKSNGRSPSTILATDRFSSLSARGESTVEEFRPSVVTECQR